MIEPETTARTGSQTTEAPQTGMTPEQILGPNWTPSPDDVRLGYCEFLRATLTGLRSQAWGLAENGELESLRDFAERVGNLSDAFHNIGEMLLPENFPWMSDAKFRELHLRPLSEKAGLDFEAHLDLWTKSSAASRALVASATSQAAPKPRDTLGRARHFSGILGDLASLGCRIADAAANGEDVASQSGTPLASEIATEKTRLAHALAKLAQEIDSVRAEEFSTLIAGAFSVPVPADAKREGAA